jgi:hypothetical protein
MWMISTTGDDTEILCCEVCREPFPTLEAAWLAWPVAPRRGVSVAAVWVHRRCVDGEALRLFGTGEFRLRRADFAIRALLQRLLWKPAE